MDPTTRRDEADSSVIVGQTTIVEHDELPVAEVVTNLHAEDIAERKDSKARHLAQFILFSKESKKTANHSSAASRQVSRVGTRQPMARRELVTSFEALPVRELVYGCDEDPDVVTRPLHKSYNLWPYATG